MTAPLPVAVIDGRVGRKVNNALTMKFFMNTGFDGAATEPFATAVQGQADGAGGKLLVLFGFRNGSHGKHVLTHAAGGRLDVPTLDWGPTAVLRDGHPLATVLREGTPLDGKFHTSKENAPVSGPSTATLPDGSLLFTFLPYPVEPETSDRDRILVVNAAGASVGTIDVIRSSTGWNPAAELLEFALEGFDTSPGGSLSINVLGTRLVLYSETTQVERDVLLAVCVELGISLRGYFAAMGTVTLGA